MVVMSLNWRFLCMKRYISKLLFSFLYITLLSNSLIAMEQNKGTNVTQQTTNSSQQTNQTELPKSIKQIEPWSTSANVTLGAGLGIVFLGVGVCIYKYLNNSSIHQAMDKKLNVISNLGQENFSFQNYRVTDQFSDESSWPTAKDVLEQKNGEKGVKAMLYNDILQQTRIFINGTACSFDDKPAKIKVYLSIKIAIEQEMSALRRSILLLNEHTEAAKFIAEILNEKTKGAIKRPGNLDQMYAALSKYAEKDLEDVATSLINKIEKEQKWWKPIFYPHYKNLSLQYWEFVKRYVRTCALRNVVDEDYKSLIKPQENN